MPDEGFDPTLAEDLKAGAGVWDAGKNVQRADQPIGRFQVEIANATLGRSQSSGRLQISYELVISAGEHKGKTIRKYDGLDTDQQASIAQGSLKNLGVDVKTMELKKLPATLVSLRSKTVMVNAKQNGDFYNIYFLRPSVKPQAAGAAPKKM